MVFRVCEQCEHALHGYGCQRMMRRNSRNYIAFSPIAPEEPFEDTLQARLTSSILDCTRLSTIIDHS